MIFRPGNTLCVSGIFLLTSIFLSVIIPLAAKADGEWCNGSTYDSDSYCLGSNPSSPAFFIHGSVV